MTDTKVKFEGETRGFEQGGNCADGNGEAHDSPRSKDKTVGQDAAISKCITKSDDSTLDESKVTGTSNREIGPAEAVRRANNHSRDKISNLGKGKPSSVVTE